MSECSREIDSCSEVLISVQHCGLPSMPSMPTPHNTAQLNSIWQCRVVKRSAVLCSIMQGRAVQCSALCSVVQFCTVCSVV